MRSVGETSWSRCSRSAGDRPTRCPASNCVLRSFRTYMSIEKRVDSFSRSFRTLEFFSSARAIDIQDLKDLKRTRDVFSASRTMARDRPSPYDEGRDFCRRGPGRHAALLHRDREVSPTGAPLVSRPGRCLHRFMKHPLLIETTRGTGPRATGLKRIGMLLSPRRRARPVSMQYPVGETSRSRCNTPLLIEYQKRQHFARKTSSTAQMP